MNLSHFHLQNQYTFNRTQLIEEKRENCDAIAHCIGDSYREHPPHEDRVVVAFKRKSTSVRKILPETALISTLP